MYEPFVAEWRRAFPASLHVLRAEDLYDAPVPTRAALFGFLGLQPPEPAESAGAVPRSYAQMHAASLEGPTAEARAPPMAPFLHDPLVCTTTVVAGATHQRGVHCVSAAPDAIPLSEQDAAEAAARSVRARRSRHLVASGCLGGISRAWSLTSLGLDVPQKGGST